MYIDWLDFLGAYLCSFIVTAIFTMTLSIKSLSNFKPHKMMIIDIRVLYLFSKPNDCTFGYYQIKVTSFLKTCSWLKMTSFIWPPVIFNECILVLYSKYNILFKYLCHQRNKFGSNMPLKGYVPSFLLYQ